MNPENVVTGELRTGDGLRVRTDFECGHGMVSLTENDRVEVEVVAFSKDARYVCMELSAERDCMAEVRVIPDRRSGMGFVRFQSWIWKMDEGSDVWRPLQENEVRISESHIDIRLPMKAGQRTVLSSEMMLPYSQTCEWLKRLSGTQGFALVELGSSFEGRPIYCLQRLTSDGSKPRILLLAGEHGTEFAGEFVARGMLAAVLEESTRGRELREKYDWGIVLNCNPDGNVNGWHQYNSTDWRNHRYPFPGDISWHHEFGPFLLDPEADVAPEAVAIGTWVLNHKPSYIFNMHSWQANDGNIGAYRAATTMQKHPVLMGILDDIADEIVAGFPGKVRFLRKVSNNPKSGHLGDTLSVYSGIPCCAPEAHMIVGAENLRHFGYTWLQRGLCHPAVHGFLSTMARDVNERYKVLPGMSRIAKQEKVAVAGGA